MGVAIIFESNTGNTAEMATLIEQGAAAKGAKSTLIEVASFDPSQLSEYDAFAFGCPASGSEQLEQSIFKPMWDSVQTPLAESKKKVVLFGSYGWGGGEYMETWKHDAQAAGVNIIDAIAGQDSPDDEISAILVEAGEHLAE